MVGCSEQNQCNSYLVQNLWLVLIWPGIICLISFQFSEYPTWCFSQCSPCPQLVLRQPCGGLGGVWSKELSGAAQPSDSGCGRQLKDPDCREKSSDDPDLVAIGCKLGCLQLGMSPNMEVMIEEEKWLCRGAYILGSGKACKEGKQLDLHPC